MTTYSTSFDSDTVGAAPAGWTGRWVTSNSTYAVRAKTGTQGGQALEYTFSVDGRRLLSMDAVDADANRDNVEVLVRFRYSSTITDVFRVVARASGASGTENAYQLIVNASAATITLHKYVAGVSTNLGSAVSFSAAVNTWFYARFRVNGTSLQGKIWAESQSEPTDWMVSVTDSSVTAAGWVGIGQFNVTGTRDVDLVSIGTNGDSAPLAVSTTTPVRTHQAVVEGVLATVANARTHQVVLEGALATVANARVQQAVLEMVIGTPTPAYLHQAVLEVVVANVAADVQQPRMIVIC